MTSFLDKTFNLASACRRGALGVVLGLALAAVILIPLAPRLPGDTKLWLFLLIVVASTVPFALWGARQKPRAATQESLGVAIWRAIAFYAVPLPTEDWVPERITIRHFFWYLLFICNVFLLAWHALSGSAPVFWEFAFLPAAILLAYLPNLSFMTPVTAVLVGSLFIPYH